MPDQPSAGAAPGADGHSVLRRWAERESPQALRARIVLLAAEGLRNADIARHLGVSRQTVTTWRQRYAAEGIEGLQDRARTGRPTEVDEGEIVVSVLAPEAWAPKTGVRVLLEQPVITERGSRRVVMAVPIARLGALLRDVDAQASLRVEHVYDF